MRARFSLASVLVLASCGGEFSTLTASDDSGVVSPGTGSTMGTSGSSGAGGRTGSNGGGGGTAARANTGGTNTGGTSDGGAPSDGGSPGAGGFLDTGGTFATGGAPSGTGGKPPTGGAVATGGVNTGGLPATGGSRPTGGAVSSGGVVSTGGLPQTGGFPPTGGAPPTGGIVGSGGIVASGGIMGSGGGPDCSSQCAAQGLVCCDGRCVNTNNDPFRCGGCDTKCPNDMFFCSAGHCGTPLCFSIPPPPPPVPDGPDASLPNIPVPIGCGLGQTCCGNVCCDTGTICCEVNYSVTTYQCVNPQDPQGTGTCPVGCPQCVCTSPDTPIATPDGDRAIATLAVGDAVYTVRDGRVVAAPIAEVHRSAVNHHVVVHVELSNGSVLDVSPPHPTADGRLFADLRAGDVLGGIVITRVTRVPYPFAHTYDILPASETGTYFAGGVPIGSTLGGASLASGAFDETALTLPR